MVVVVVDARRRLGGSGRWWWLLSTLRVVWEVVEKVDTSRINDPDRPCHRPVTRQNGEGNVTGVFIPTRPRPALTRTRDPSRVAIPVSITRAN